MLCAKFGWNWPSGSGEEDENVKVKNNANNGQIVIRKAHSSPRLRWAKTNNKKTSYVFDTRCSNMFFIDNISEVVFHIRNYIEILQPQKNVSYYVISIFKSYMSESTSQSPSF